MRAQMGPRLAKWPFIVGDILLLGLGVFIVGQSAKPMGVWQIGFIVVCVMGGACLALMPFLLEYRVAVRLVEAQSLAAAVAQVQNIEAVANQISQATAQWQGVQEAAGKTASASNELAQRMGKEVQAFSDFMQKLNESEKTTLRLEVDKLRRAEAEWLQVLVRVLDHIYALHLGGLRSGQPNLIENLTNFQNACRDAARRVGLTAFQAAPAEPFDAQRHQLPDGEQPVGEGLVSETLASGYTFQGRLLRPAVVRLSANGKEQVENERQTRLPLRGDSPSP